MARHRARRPVRPSRAAATVVAVGLLASGGVLASGATAQARERAASAASVVRDRHRADTAATARLAGQARAHFDRLSAAAATARLNADAVAHFATLAAVEDRADAAVRAAATLARADVGEDLPAALDVEPDGPLSALAAAVEQVAAAREVAILPDLKAAIASAEQQVLEAAQAAAAEAAARPTEEDRALLAEATVAPLDEAADVVGAAAQTGDVTTAALAAVAATDRADALQHAAEAERQRIAEAAAAAALHEQRLAWSTSLDGYGNGRIPLASMVELTWAPGHFLRGDAAEGLESLHAAFRETFGADLSVTSSYRSFDGQVAARASFGRLAAVPGTSRHGIGIAVDLGGGINRFGTPQHQWFVANGPAFGWHQPDWARQNGAMPEPWHFEFVSLVNPGPDLA
jgi:hypothetical protein